MSLINDALKKAQRLRTEDTPADTPPVPAGVGGVKIAKRAEARSANTMVLIGGGVLLLIVLSVALTVYLLKRPAAPAPAPVAVTSPTTAPAPSPTNPAVAPPTDATAGTPPVVAPKTEKPPAPTAVEPKSVAVTPSAPQPAAPVSPPPKTDPASSAPNVATANRPAAPAAPLVTEPAPVAPVTSPPTVAAPVPASTAKADDRVTAYIEGLKVTGIRSSGTESRVLMNERVYRVNDVVERTLGIRLTKVAVDSLTFSDTNGVTYIKYF